MWVRVQFQSLKHPILSTNCDFLSSFSFQIYSKLWEHADNLFHYESFTTYLINYKNRFIEFYHNSKQKLFQNRLDLVFDIHEGNRAFLEHLLFITPNSIMQEKIFVLSIIRIENSKNLKEEQLSFNESCIKRIQ